ncbi:MAG: hypothetical protein AAFV88_19165 [Planctomycetota bacterium]
MKCSSLFFLVLAGCLVVPMSASTVSAQDSAVLDTPADAAKLPGAREVFQKHLSALGDADEIAAVKSVKMTGKISMPAMNLNGTLEIIQVKPNKIATVMDLPQVGKQTQVFDGEMGWMGSDLMGMQKMPKEQIEQMKAQMAIETMEGFRETFKKVRITGKQEYDGKDSYVMKAVTKTDSEMTMFFDVETGLMRGMKSVQATPMGDIPVQLYMRDYKVTGPMKSARTTVVKAGPTELVMTVEEVEVDGDIPEETFKRPADL